MFLACWNMFELFLVTEKSNANGIGNKEIDYLALPGFPRVLPGGLSGIARRCYSGPVGCVLPWACALLVQVNALTAAILGVTSRPSRPFQLWIPYHILNQSQIENNKKVSSGSSEKLNWDLPRAVRAVRNPPCG